MKDTTLVTRAQVLQARVDFFKEVVRELNTPPTKVDLYFGQAGVFRSPVNAKIVTEPEVGNLWVPYVLEARDGKQLEFAYSLHQIGFNLRIAAVLISPELKNLADMDSSDELRALWPESKPVESTRGATRMLEWTFENSFYLDDYLKQERFILGIRHTNFRLLVLLDRLLK